MQAKTVHPFSLCLLGIVLLSGCAATRTPIYAPVTTDYTIRVQQAFEALPNGSHIDFQQGQRIQHGSLDRWSTYCRLYVYNRNHGADYHSSVALGRIEISAVKAAYQSSDYPTQPGFGRLSWGVRNIPSYYLYSVGMRLTSPDQPDVRSLTCYKKWATPHADQYPTLAEIRAALGEQIKLESPGSG